VTGHGLAEQRELVQRARVEQDAARDVPPSRGATASATELDLQRREARGDRALDFPVARRVDVQPKIAEQREDAPARVRLIA